MENEPQIQTMPRIYLVLVRTMYSSNFGATARVAENMGCNQILMIDPQCEMNSKARQGAARAQKMLKKTAVYSSWEDFYKIHGQGVRIAFTRRGGKKRVTRDLKETLLGIYNAEPKGDEGRSNLAAPLYLIFGPEDDGLNSEDIEFVNFCCSLPIFGENKSLNLSQATLLASFIVQDVFQGLGIRNAPTCETNKLSSNNADIDLTQNEEKLHFPDQTLKDWLTTLGFDNTSKRKSAYTVLRKTLLSNLPSNMEYSVIESVLQQNIRKLKGNKQQDIQ